MINVKKELKNIGIKPIEELSVQEKTYIAEKVATKLASLKVEGVTHNQILEQLFDAQMYTAQMNSNLGNVKYFSQNKTIYFNKNINLVNLDESILRECIHYLQDQTKIKELCKIEKSQVKGKALNEVGINYILNKLFNKNDNNKALILLNQLVAITGEDICLDSILNNNNKFEKKFIEQTNSEVLYYKVQNTFEAMFDLEQIINRLNIEGRKSKKPERYLSKINMHKQTLNYKFSEIQWEIYNKYFSRKIELIEKLEEIKKYKNEIFDFNQWLDIYSDELKYTNFAKEKFEKLNKIEQDIIKRKSNNSMTLFKENIIYKIIKTVRKIVLKSKENEIK